MNVYLYKQCVSLFRVNLSSHQNAKWIEECASWLELSKGKNIYRDVRKNYGSFTLLAKSKPDILATHRGFPELG